MSRIESRPAQTGRWHWGFFIDLEGHVEDAPVATALKRLKKEAAQVKVLGSYPVAVL